MKFIKTPGVIICTCILFIFWKPIQEIEEKVKPGNIEDAITEIKFAAGRLDITGADMPNLMEGRFSFTEEEWNPEISYNDQGSSGILRIENDLYNDDYDFDDDDECHWDIKVNSNIPNDVNIEIFAGASNIDLSNCELRRLRYKMKAGESKINLRNSSVPDFRFRAIAGEATIDLSGEWRNNLNASLKGGIGEMNIIVPKNVGVHMEVSGFLGSVNTPGFRKESGYYTNRAYHETPHTLYLDITGGIGEINVREVE